MGAPELPNEDFPNLPLPENIQHPPVSSDDEDHDQDAYNGYQLLSGEDPINGISTQNNQDEPISEAFVENLPNMPHVESVDSEIERQVWNQPRPSELQIELDNTRTEQILNLMANITLPNVTVPDWAEGVPEERWKEELLQRIRQRKEVQEINSVLIDKKDANN